MVDDIWAIGLEVVKVGWMWMWMFVDGKRMDGRGFLYIECEGSGLG